MVKYFVFIFMLIFNISTCYSQEALGLTTGLDYYLNCNDENNHDIIRTDQEGNILWRLSFSNDNSFFDSTQTYYLSLGYTYVKNNKIISDPTEHDYWLIPKPKNINFFIYPNPNLGLFNILNYSDENEIQLEIYDSSNRLIISKKLINVINNIDLLSFNKGVYYIKLFNNDEILKFEKICIN